MRLAAATMVLLTFALTASAAASDKPHDCDYQAAHRQDPDRMAPGVTIDEVVPRLAIAACQAAIKEFPGEARFVYQLGRAHAAANRDAEALAAYTAAAEAGYRMANHNLGLAYQELGDYEQARTRFQLAADAGVEVSRENLASLTFTGQGFSNPAFFDAIYNDNLQGGSGAILYVASFLQLFNNTDGCRKVATNGITVRAAQLAQQSAMGQMFNALRNADRDGTFEGAGKGGYEAGQKLATSMAMQVQSVQDDANLFYTRYSCNSPIAIQFFDHLGDWVFDLG